MNFNIDAAIFIGFLAVNLAIGLFYSQGIKNIRDYAIGNRNFSTATIAATLVATWISGGSFSLYMSETYTQGLYFILAIFADAGSFLIIGFIFAPRMAEFLGQLSVAEAMGSLYGKNVRIITALAGFIGTIGALALQLKVSSIVLTYLFGISTIYSTIASSLVVILYSSFGGIRSVTFTDLIQFFMFTAIIPIVIFTIWGSIDNSDNLIETISNNPLFDYKVVFDYQNPKFWSAFTIFLYFLIPGLSPATFQRITMARNIGQIQSSFFLAAIVLLAVELLIAWIAVLVLSINPTLDPNNILTYIIDTYAYIGLKGLIVTGIMAMVMSTADSYINSAAILVVHDVFRPLGIVSEKKELYLSRISSVVLGIIALVFTFSGASFLNLFLLGYSFYMIVVTVPFIMAILGFRTTTKPVLIGMTAGIATVIVWSNFGAPEIDSVIPGMLANLVAFFLSHYLLKQPGGWIGIKNPEPLILLRNERKRNIRIFIKSIKDFSLWDFCKSNLPKNEYVYSIFGLFCLISVFSTIYSIPKNIQLAHKELIEFVYDTVLVLASMLLTFPIWPSWFKQERFIVIVWNIVLPYILIFAPTLLIIVSNFGQFQLMIFMLNIIIIAMILRWQAAIFMVCFTVFLSVEGFKSYVGVDYLSAAVDVGTQFKIMYVLLLVSSVLVAFLKPKQEQQELTEKKNEHLSGRIATKDKEVEEALALKAEFIRNVNHEYHAPMTGVISMAEALQEGYDRLTDDQKKDAIDVIVQSSHRLKVFDENITTLSRLNKPNFKLAKENLNFSDLVYERLAACRNLYAENKEEREFISDIEEGLMANVDKEYITQLLDNLIINAIKYCPKGKINIILKKGEGSSGLEFVIKDDGIGVPKEELEHIFEPFVVSSRTKTQAGGRGVGLSACKRILEVHGGTIKAESDGKNGTAFRFVIP